MDDPPSPPPPWPLSYLRNFTPSLKIARKTKQWCLLYLELLPEDKKMLKQPKQCTKAGLGDKSKHKMPRVEEAGGGGGGNSVPNHNSNSIFPLLYFQVQRHFSISTLQAPNFRAISREPAQRTTQRAQGTCVQLVHNTLTNSPPTT